MRHFLRWSSLALLCLGLLLIGSYIQAQDDGGEDPPQQYVGSTECSRCHADMSRPIIAFCEEADACHRNAMIRITESNMQTAIFADFSTGEDLRTVQFPGEDEPREFRAEDVSLVQGSRYVQRYIYEQSPTQYTVLPAQWNINTEEWEPFEMGSWPDDYDWGTNCAGCHTTGLNVETMEWVDNGVQCEACHGPGYEHVEMALDLPRRASNEELDALRASIYIGPDPQICAQCHSQGMSGEYHYPVDYAPGQNDLHDVFTVVDHEDTDYWWPTDVHGNQSNMQYNEWLPSGHAMALEDLQTADSAEAECLSCHSTDYYWNQRVIEAFETGYWEGEAPDPITLDMAQYGITCISCHKVHTDDPTTDYYIVEEPYSLCTSCHGDPDPSNGLHAATQQLYEGFTAVEAVEGIPSSHFTAEDGPDCMSCHMPRLPVDSFTLASHSLHIVDPAFDIEAIDDSCTTCHGEQADGPAMSKLIDDIQTGTAARIEGIKAAMAESEEVAEWVTVALQFVESEGSLGVHNYPYTDALLDAIEAELNLSGEISQ